MIYRFLNPMDFDDGRVQLSEHFDLSFLGSSVDKRGTVSKHIATRYSTKQHHIEYDHKALVVRLNDKALDLRDFLSKPLDFEAERVLIDATNLSFAEMAILLRLFLKSKRPMLVSFLYVEPKKYTTKVWSPTQIRPFNLSKKIYSVDFIPSFYKRTRPNQNSSLLAFLGFEDMRFSKVVDADSGNNFTKISAVFSVPPFQSGWDTHSLMVNSRVISEQQLHEACFTAGNQPYEAFKLIERYELLAVKESSALTLAPFGTKPSTIAVSLAAAANEELSVLFDFPEKNDNRSTGVGIIHFYPIELTAN